MGVVWTNRKALVRDVQHVAVQRDLVHTRVVAVDRLPLLEDEAGDVPGQVGVIGIVGETVPGELQAFAVLALVVEDLEVVARRRESTWPACSAWAVVERASARAAVSMVTPSGRYTLLNAA